MAVDWDEDDEEVESDSPFHTALAAGRVDEAEALLEQRAADPETPAWLVRCMLEDLGRGLVDAGRHDDAIAAFERAIPLGRDVVPDGRCDLARVLQASRHEQADALWRELRDADPEGVWTLNAGGTAYAEVGRDVEAIEWLGEAVRLAMAREVPEHVVDGMSDTRRVSLRRAGQELDRLEREVEAFRARAAVRRQEEMDECRAAAAREGVPVRSGPATAAWIRDEDDHRARERWPGWVDSLAADQPLEERRLKMERRLRKLRGQGGGPFVIVTIDLDDYASWCTEHGHEPIDRRSRASFVEVQRALGEGGTWPPGRNEPCWCGSQRKYKRCCGG